MKAHNTLLLFGGASDERLVSVATAQNLIRRYPFQDVWFLGLDGSVSRVAKEELEAHQRPFEVPFRPKSGPFARALKDTLSLLKETTVFIGLHGTEGEDGTLQALFEKSRIAFTGSGSESSRLCFDKRTAKTRVASQGVRVAPGLEIVKSSSLEIANVIAPFQREHGKLALKPVASGSSFGLHIISSPDDIATVAEKIAASPYDRYLAEAFITGRELTVGVLADRTPAIALPASEVVLTADSFDYQGKYLGRGTREITPAELTPQEMKAAQELALRSHAALGCYGYSRTDMILSASGPVFLETNTLPGLTKASFIPQQLEASGMDVRDFIENQMELARARYGS